MRRTKIVGAGISGLSAAITLAKAGHNVDVFEKNEDVGKRFRGDLEGLENWSEKEDILNEFKRMNITVNFDCDPFSTLTVTNGSKTKEIKFEKPLFYLVKRGSMPGSLDYGLKEQALALGVCIHFGKTIPQDQADIVATGPTFNEIAGIDKGIAFKTTMKDTAVLLLNDKAAYKGYAYLLVTKGYGCMCTVVLDELTSVAHCFEETKNIFSTMMDLGIQEPKKVGGIGSFSTKNVFKKDKSLFVGEAAGLQDFLWGFGMRYAVTSGFLAAQSILDNKDYEQTAQKYFSHKLKASITNRYLWEKCDRIRYSLMVKNGRIMKAILYRMHRYNFIQKMVYPLAVSYLRKRYGDLRL
ncbi:MAG: NAD(P)/FAD-dependent oxidoreductase [Theionarchaea archaeon]|nr:MAG: hypothetical protein AYK19_14960 [Theionarchaea archaeon DG-70-1]MBU7027500.1 NAD(P)/FAD-dependent oxidoreductase [Theionarchaea archaeon]